MKSTSQGCREGGEGPGENSGTMKLKQGREPAEETKKEWVRQIEGVPWSGQDCPVLGRQARTGKGMPVLSAGKAGVTLSMLGRSQKRNKVSNRGPVSVENSCRNCGRAGSVCLAVCGSAGRACCRAG